METTIAYPGIVVDRRNGDIVYRGLTYVDCEENTPDPKYQYVTLHADQYDDYIDNLVSQYESFFETQNG